MIKAYFFSLAYYIFIVNIILYSLHLFKVESEEFIFAHIQKFVIANIEVDLPGHPGYALVYRKRYVDRSASAREAEGMRSAMLFGSDANPLGILVELGEAESRFRLGAAGSKRVRVPFVVKIPIVVEAVATTLGADDFTRRPRVPASEADFDLVVDLDLVTRLEIRDKETYLGFGHSV